MCFFLSFYTILFIWFLSINSSIDVSIVFLEVDISKGYANFEKYYENYFCYQIGVLKSLECFRILEKQCLSEWLEKFMTYFCTENWTMLLFCFLFRCRMSIIFGLVLNIFNGKIKDKSNIKNKQISRKFSGLGKRETNFSKHSN